MTESIPVSMLRQWRFCPRLPWFMLIEGRRPPAPEWVAQGIRFDAHQATLTASRKYRRLGLDDANAVNKPQLQSAELGLHGVPDLVLVRSDQVVVVEFKLARPGLRSGLKLQLAAYARLAQKNWNRPCKWTAMLTGRRMQVEWIEQTERLQARLNDALKSLRDTLNSPMMPDSVATGAQCDQCEYLRFCNDRF
ncbi:MAG: CRISPR-associated protein Cas4 [Wenzhouxiangellaceae bacterium]|nr:CRISPR-associated protein Cas4 [Wenzhouxiangellaceae bacterium]